MSIPWPANGPAENGKQEFEITPARVSQLAEILGQPMLYVQRLVEQLSFTPTGGQRWQRTLQVRIPEHAEPLGPSWRVVPLGQFKRKRLADITVCNADGKRLNLLTRRQHGTVLTNVMTVKYSSALTPRQEERLMEPSASRLDRKLRLLFHEYFTSHESEQLSRTLRLIRAQYRSLLDALGVTTRVRNTRVKEFYDELVETTRGTPYLCWVLAEPGEVVNLQVSYSAVDPKHRTEQGGLGDALKAFITGIIPLRRPALREVRAEWYRRYGLAPIDYKFEIPKQGTGSYYLTLEPPSYTEVTYLDWETDDSFNLDTEVDCALPAVHVHNDERFDGSGTSGEVDEEPAEELASVSGVTRAYLRCTPHLHKQILGATGLNIAVIWLLGKGKLTVGLNEPLQGLIAGAPSVLLAFLAQQQRHYYAHVMQRQRAMLWGYLLLSVAFLVAVAFQPAGNQGFGVGATVAAWALAISSAGVFAWHAFIGGLYDRIVKYLTDRKWEVIDRTAAEGAGRLRTLGTSIRRTYWRRRGIALEVKWECYNEAVTQFCSWICVVVVLAIIGAIVLLRAFGDDFALQPVIPTIKGVSKAEVHHAIKHNSAVIVIPTTERPEHVSIGHHHPASPGGRLAE